MSASPWTVLLVAGTTILSGLADARGFTHAARIWRDGRFAAGEAARSALGFAVGIGLYYLVLRDVDRLGVTAPEVQTLGWFGVTLVGVALFSGRFLTWRWPEQAVGVAVLVGIAWLMARTAER